MAFNPDDFQFERILPPEERKPILEWDALHRLMVVRVKQDGEWTYLATKLEPCLLYTSPSPRDGLLSRMPSSA